MASQPGKTRLALGWLLVILFAFCQLGPILAPGLPPALPLLGSFAVVAFGIVHGSVRYGWWRMIAAVIVVFVLGIAIENFSVETGFPFGFFEHTDVFGPKLWHIPYLIGLLYFTLTYTGWAVANLLLGEADRDGRRTSLYALPLVAAFIPAAMDATFDPVGATLYGNWHFQGGGGFFGVPLANFLGIMFVNYVCYQIFAWYLDRHPRAMRVGQPLGWWLQPLAIMGIYAVAPFLLMALGPTITAIDPGGAAWESRHVYEGLAVASICGIAFLTVTGAFIALRKFGR